MPTRDVIAAAVVTPVPPLATGKVPVTLVVKLANVVEVVPVPPLAIGKVPVTPVVSGSPVQLVKVPDDGVPRTGVTRVGEVPNTNAPEPVSPVTAAARFAELGVAKKVATLVPKPEIPVATGRPVQDVKVPDCGVPKMGVTSVGLVESTTDPVPVEAVTPVPPLATGKVPVTPVVRLTLVMVLLEPLMVLLVRVSAPAKVASVPVVGNVIEVVAVVVSVVANAPEVVNAPPVDMFPPSVIVRPVFATPVPPFAPGKTPVTSLVLMSI